MIPRTTKPEVGNPYYNTKDAGGYSRAIRGRPTISGLNVFRNCVGYAYGRFHEAIGRKEMDLFDPVNAENIYQNAIDHGLMVGPTPKAGALIVWQKGATLSSGDGAGHVAFIESVNPDGTVTVSESGWNVSFDWRIYKLSAPYSYGSGYKFLGFVYPPEQNPYPVPTKALKKGSIGSDVKWLQYELCRKGYLRDKELDGDFGTITLGALLAYQLEHKLKVDGICGPATIRQIKMES